MGMRRVQKRFDELAEMADQLANDEREHTTHSGGGTNWLTKQPIPVRTRTTKFVDLELATRWQTSVLSLLVRVLGEDDPTSARFRDAAKSGSVNERNRFLYLKSIFLAAKDDFEGGYLFDIRSLVHAEVFSDELEQADYFLSEGHKVPAAVIAGTVLETTLREMCDQHPDIEPAKADKMISDLAKQSAVNKMRADQLRAWMKTRNSAAHGKPDEFETGDVTRMIEGIRDFVAHHMS